MKEIPAWMPDLHQSVHAFSLSQRRINFQALCGLNANLAIKLFWKYNEELRYGFKLLSYEPKTNQESMPGMTQSMKKPLRFRLFQSHIASE